MGLPSLVRRLAFGSCAQQDEPQPLWMTIAATKPDLFVMLGDNIYGDSPDPAVLRAKYDKLANVPEFRSFRAARPLLATWDDHDYGQNDGGADFTGKEASKATFLDFFGVPADSPRRHREGVYDAVTIGPEGRRVQVILLDTRWSRGPLPRERKPDGKPGRYLPVEDPTVPMLGAEQWAWLAERLREPAELRLLVSSIQVIAEDHGYETWANLPRERERLFRTIREAKATGVVFLSGDRHLAELSLMDGNVGYPLYDLTSSAINRSARRWRPLEVNRHRVATMNVGDNFGVVAVDWDAKDPLVRLEIRDAAGDARIVQKLPLSLLRPKPER